VAPPHPWGALVTACLALFLIAVNTTAINTAVSAIADDLTISSTTLGWALNACAQQGTVYGFDASMLVIAVSSVGGLVLWLVLMRPARRRVSRPSPASLPSAPS
jgi:hypothetical protein